MQENIPQKNGGAEKPGILSKLKECLALPIEVLAAKMPWLKPILDLCQRQQTEGWKVQHVIGAFIVIAVLSVIGYFTLERMKHPLNTNEVKANGNAAAVNQVSQSSNISLNNNSGNVTFSNHGNAYYQNGTNGNISIPTISANTVQSTYFVPTTISLPSSTVGNITVNITPGTGNNNTQVEAQIQQLRRDLDNESEVTTQDVLTLTKLVSELDVRTKDIHRLSDGRTSLGDVIAIGSVDNFSATLSKAVQGYNNSDFRTCFEYSVQAIGEIESNQIPWVYEIVSLRPEAKAEAYNLAASAAIRLGSNVLAYTYAKKTISIGPNPSYKMTLVAACGNMGNQAIREHKFANAFAYYVEGITNYEGIATSDTNDLPQIVVSRLYNCAAYAAFITGRTNAAFLYGRKANEIEMTLKVQ